MKTVNITVDGKAIFSGATLFNLQATHGLPLSFSLDTIINGRNTAVDWPEFIDTARQNGRWDYQTIESVGHALVDADVSVELRTGIINRMKKYILATPHPSLAH